MILAAPTVVNWSVFNSFVVYSVWEKKKKKTLKWSKKMKCADFYKMKTSITIEKKRKYFYTSETKKNNRYINILWPLTKHHNFIIQFRIASSYIILRSAHKEHWLLLFALGSWDRKSNTHQTPNLWYFTFSSFFFKDWNLALMLKKAHTHICLHDAAANTSRNRWHRFKEIREKCGSVARPLS